MSNKNEIMELINDLLYVILFIVCLSFSFGVLFQILTERV